MNELTCYNWKCSKKNRKLLKKDKFVTNERKISLSWYSFILFMKLRLIVFVSHIILSENLLNETKKMIQNRNFELVLNFACDFEQFYGSCFFQWLKRQGIIQEFNLGVGSHVSIALWFEVCSWRFSEVWGVHWKLPLLVSLPTLLYITMLL